MTAPTQTSEVTALPPDREKAFWEWVQQHHIRDVDQADSHYDYRGAFLEGATPRAGHWPDRFKQHGHPTFSVESKYSRGPADGGHWVGDRFVPPKRAVEGP